MRNSLYPRLLRMGTVHKAYGGKFAIGIIYLIKQGFLFFSKGNLIFHFWKCRRTIFRKSVIHGRFYRPIHPCFHIFRKQWDTENSQMESLLIIEQFLELQVRETLTSLGSSFCALKINLFAISNALYAIHLSFGYKNKYFFVYGKKQ